MATIKENDFIEMDYTGKLKEDNSIFDTTVEKVAKENHLHDQKAKYESIVICVGQNYMLQGLEEQMVGKEAGKEYTIEVSNEKAYGKKDAKMIQMIPMSKFKQQKIDPFPGLQLNIDGAYGIVKTVSGGRIMVDFNHPLAGKGLVYDVTVKKIVEDDKEKLTWIIRTHLQHEADSVTVKEGNAEVGFHHEIPKPLAEEFSKLVNKIIPSINKVDFIKTEMPKEEKHHEHDGHDHEGHDHGHKHTH